MADNLSNNNDNKTAVDEMVDTTGLMLDYLANWKWFAISVVACLIGAYFIIASIVPTYEVKASIYLNNQNQNENNPFSLDVQNPLLSMKSYIDETELEILKSRNNVIKIVDSLEMYYSYWRVGGLRNIPLYENNAIDVKLDSVSLSHLKKPIILTVGLGSDSTHFDITAETMIEEAKDEKEFKDVTLPFDVETAQGTVTVSRVSHVPELEGTEKIYIRNPRAVAEALSKGLDIAFADKAPTIVRISYRTPVVQEGVDVLNTLVDFYNRQIIEDKNQSALQTEAFILARLVNVNDELRDVEQRLSEYRQAHNISDLGAQVQTSLQTTTATEGQLADVDAQLHIIASIESLVAQASIYQPLPSVTTDQTLNQIIEAYNKKISQYNRLTQTSTPDNPVVRTLQDELTRDKSRILQNIATVKNGLNARRANIQSIERRSEGELASLPPIDKGLQEIFREQQVKVNIYTFLLQKREEIALQKTLATPTARLIDNPDGGEGPVSPRKIIIYFIAFLLGLGIPAGIIFLKRLFFPVFKDQDELQRLTNVPILGEISVNNSKDGSPIVVGRNVTTAIAELFRLLRNNITFTKNGARKKVILLTSSISGEGKTFIATNLAMTYALTGKKVVVVGMDIRRPMLAHQFGFTNQQGVTTFLSGHTDDVKALLHQSKECENLYVLPAGPVPPNPNELLLSDNMKRLMEQLRADFDYVIIDSAPIGVISDSYIIIPYSDIQLYVARAGYSTKSCLKVLHLAVRDNRLPDPYIVLNGVNMLAGSYTYRRYGYYHKGSKSTYGYGYSSDVATRPDKRK